MSRCVLGSHRSLEETGSPLGPMIVRTVAEVAVTSWTDSERRPSAEEDDLELEPDEDEDDEPEDDDDDESELVLLVEVVLSTEDARGRDIREVGVWMLRLLLLASSSGRVVSDVGVRGVDVSARGESIFVTLVTNADVEAAGRRVGEEGNARALATMTPFSATTS